ncbi:MAG: DUF362 domain-containing protein [Deltaproteobacteria bacterium]|nr:DUF362 domain-containing protein [Deltaproteobacteria bacterium]
MVLKINLLQAEEPEKAVTTHPELVASVARLVKQEGATPIIADSPGSGYKYDVKTLEKLYRTCGIYSAITIVNDSHALIDENECIRCYCCHEMCRSEAVELRRGLLYRMINRQ